MSSRLSAVLLGCLIAACGVGAPPSGGGGGGGGGGSGGGGSGGGDGSGSGSGGGGGGSTDTSYVATFLSGMGHKFCDEAFTCKASFPATQGGPTFDQIFGTSAMQCYSDAEAHDMPAAVASEITAGKIMWNPTDAMACLAGLTFPACTDYWMNGANFPAACQTAMVGTVADGGACIVDYDCQNVQSYCDATSKKCTVDTGMRTVPGTDALNYLATAMRR